MWFLSFQGGLFIMRWVVQNGRNVWYPVKDKVTLVKSNSWNYVKSRYKIIWEMGITHEIFGLEKQVIAKWRVTDERFLFWQLIFKDKEVPTTVVSLFFDATIK